MLRCWHAARGMAVRQPLARARLAEVRLRRLATYSAESCSQRSPLHAFHRVYRHNTVRRRTCGIVFVGSAACVAGTYCSTSLFGPWQSFAAATTTSAFADSFVPVDDHNSKQRDPPSLGALQYAFQTVCFVISDMLRMAQLACIFAPTILSLPLLVWTDSSRRLHRVVMIWSVQMAGPTFVKLGQWASTRPDIFSKNVCASLSVLQSNVTPENGRDIQHRLEEYLGMTITEAFDEFQEVPIGCGCVAQVFKARVSEHGTELGTRLSEGGISRERYVAIKILRSGISDLFERDLRLMRGFVHAAQWLIPGLKWIALAECIDMFSDHMKNQLDLRVEANNLIRFQENFRRSQASAFFSQSECDHVRFPEPLVAQEGVLIQTFEEGDPILSVLLNADEDPPPDGASSEATKAEKKLLADIGVRAFLKMVLVDNYVHGDLHPGNILVQRATADKQPSLVFLDAGLVVELSERDRLNFLQVFQAVAQKDGRKVGQLMLDQARTHNCKDREAFLVGMEQVVNVVDTFSLGKIRIGSVLSDVLFLVRENEVQLESAFTTLVLSIVLLEGLGRQLNPELDIFAVALPMLAKLQFSSAFRANKARREE